MRVSQVIIDQILDRTDIVDLINSRVKLKKAGKSYTACCPFHQEKSPSFHVHRDKGYYHCFGCQASGNAISFLMEHDHRSFMEALSDLAQQAGIELPKSSQDDAPQLKYQRSNRPTPARTPPAKKPNQISPNPASQPAATQIGDAPPAQQDEDASWQSFFQGVESEHGDDQPPSLSDPFDPTDWPAEYSSSDQPADQPIDQGFAAELLDGSLYSLLEAITLFYQSQLQQHLPARQYLQGRGLDGEACTFWRLGYAPTDWQHLEKAFPHDIDGLKQLGLVRISDKGRQFDLLRDRVMFPIRDRKGRVVGFGGRAMQDDVKPKYINSPESVVFNKSNLLYGLYEGRKQRAKQWLMVEGYMDVIALAQAGIHGAVAALGTAANVEHLNTLFKLEPSLTLAFDGDQAGQNAAWRTLEIALPILNDGLQLRFLVLPDKQDPDSLIRREGVSGFRERIEQAPPLSDFMYDTLARQYDLNHPEGKGGLLNAAHRLIQQLPAQGSYKHLLRQSIRERLGLGWRGKAKPASEVISFEQACSLDEKALLLLLQYPALRAHFLALTDLLPPDAMLRQLLLTLQADQFEQQLDDPDQALYFILGAWPDTEQRRDLCRLLDAVDLGSYVQRPEQLDRLCQELSLQLSEQLLTRRLRGCQSLSEARELNAKLLDIRYQLHFREPMHSLSE